MWVKCYLTLTHWMLKSKLLNSLKGQTVLKIITTKQLTLHFVVFYMFPCVFSNNEKSFWSNTMIKWLESGGRCTQLIYYYMSHRDFDDNACLCCRLNCEVHPFFHDAHWKTTLNFRLWSHWEYWKYESCTYYCLDIKLFCWYKNKQSMYAAFGF